MGYAHGTRWTKDKTIEEIRSVMRGLEIDRMPSNSEVIEWTGSHALSSRINSTGGFYYWADKLGITTKDSETGLAKRYEVKIKEMIERRGYDVKDMTTKHPYDLIVNGMVKIDVKVSNLYKNEVAGKYHTFNLEKKFPTCDIYVAITLIDKEIDRIFIIPSKFLNITQLSVGKKSIYNKYIDRWDYIEKYVELYEEII